MSNATNLKFRKSATIDRKEAPTCEGEDFSLRSDDLQSNDVTSSAVKTQNLQQEPNLQHLWSWKYSLLSMVVVLVAIFGALEFSKKQCKLDVLEAEKICGQEKLDANEKYRSDLDQAKEKCRSDLDQMKENYRSDLDQTKENYRSDLDKEKEKCRSDMDEAKEQCRSDLDQAKDMCRLDMDEEKKECSDEKQKQKYESQHLMEETEWLIECLTGTHTARDGNMLSTIINAIWRVVKTGLGMNRDVEYCLEQFKNRFQRRLSA